MTSETMETSLAVIDSEGARLGAHGLEPTCAVHFNLSPARLYEEAFAQGDGRLAQIRDSRASLG